MNRVRAIHNIAMDVRALGDEAALKGFTKEAKEFYKEAFQFEKRAALLAVEQTADDTISKYVLLRSTAALALWAEMWKESEEMIEICKAQNPPEWIVEELNELNKLVLEKQKSNSKVHKESIVAIIGKLSMINAQENTVVLNDSKQNRAFSIIFNKKYLKDLLLHFNEDINIEAKQSPHGIMVLQKIKTAA